MKRCLCFVLAALMALMCSACTGKSKTDYSEYGTSAVIDVGEATAKAGDTVDVAISFVNNPGVAAISVQLDYDTSALEAVSAKAVGKLAGTGFLLTSTDEEGADSALSDAGVDGSELVTGEDGMAKLLWFNAQNFTGEGEIMTVTFKVADNASGTYEIKVVEHSDDLVSEDQKVITDKVYLAGSVQVG